jgi:DNA polymerase epsilon subunit 1
MLQNLAPEVTQPDPNKIDEADATREFIARKLTRKLLRLVSTVQTEPRAPLWTKNCTLSSKLLIPCPP